MPMGKRELDRIKDYIQDDRPRRLKTYVKKHKLRLSGISLNKNRNLLHYCCKYGSGTMFRYLLQDGLEAYHCDDDGNSPVHLALLRALKYENTGKSQQATECYTGIILPCIEKFPRLLDARNHAEETCRELLRQLVEKRESTMPSKRNRSSSPESQHEEMSEQMWRDKLVNECQYEYQTSWGQYEQAFQETYSDRETYNDWADRIQQEYYTKKRSQSAFQESARKKQKTSQEPPKTQAGPANLEDIRAKMRKDFDRKNKTDESLKVLKERMKYEKRYKELMDTTDKGVLSYEDIPWPSKKGDNSDMTVLFEGMDKGDNLFKKYLRDQQVRWHPDKFMQRFGENLKEADKERIMTRVTKLSQELNKLLK